MKEFMLLFRGGDHARADAGQSPEGYQKHMGKWKSWMEALGKKERFIGGQPLAQAGSVISGEKKVVTDGPFIEGKEIVGGYLMIKAKDLRDAVELSKDCPIFEYGGTVEVRQVEQLGA